MAKVTIYHNPRCSKSRQALSLLQQRGVEPQIVDYLNTPPDAEQIAELLDLLRLQPRELMRSNDAEYRELDLDHPDLSREQLIRTVAEHPRLMQRPIVVSGGKAALGRPPERVLEILR
ncbi:MAG: arsenate reductase (glutaredoxin) [Gammaproteobacteria bacterium]|jgi:arsenate reductase